MKDFETETGVDLYRIWIEAQKPLRNILKAREGCFLIDGMIEVYETKVILLGKYSFDALTRFLEVLNESICILKDCPSWMS